MNSEKNRMSSDEIVKALDVIYSKALVGVEHVIPPIEKMANDYLSKEVIPSRAAKSMINYQVIKCTTAGFLSNLGGIITLPVSIPANIGSVLFVQIRMIACTAYLAGFDLENDQTQTLVFACLAGVSISELIKKSGIEIGKKLATEAIKKIPGELVTKINQAVGFRLITKSGQTGVFNLTKMVPGIGAVIGGGLDLVETKIVGKRAYNWFFDGDFAIPEGDIKDDVIYSDFTEIE